METSPKLSKNRNHEGYSESPTEVMGRYFTKLGLTQEDLVNKSILDIGAGSGKFIGALKKSGVSDFGISLDQHAPRENHVSGDEKESFVVASAHALPFADNSFDYIVAVSAIPNITGSKGRVGTPSGRFVNGIPEYLVTREDIEREKTQEKELATQIVRECLRLVKNSGEIRFGGMSKLRDAVRMGMHEALVGVGEMSTTITPEGNEFFILKKIGE